MALNNHTIDSTKITEDQVEAIITGKIKYDPASKTLVLLPAARELSNDKRILLFLAALRGWPFLLKENIPPEDASPLEITQATGIPGGSVRPLLGVLGDKGILKVGKGRYQLPSHNLAAVASLLSGQTKSLASTSVVSSQNSKSKKGGKAVQTQKGRRGTKGNKPTLAEGFAALLEQKWFKGGKTITQLKAKLDEETVFPPMSQLPWHLLKAHREKSLSRSKEMVDGKKVWVYKQN